MNYLEYSLQDEFKYRGVWWLPENPKNQLTGELTYDRDEGISLELVGSFRPLETIGGNEAFQVEVILGITTDGKRCTLLQNVETRFC